MKTTTERLHEGTSSEKMTTLSSSVNQAAEKGYTTEFAVQANGMLWDSKDRYYDPEEVLVDNFYRFEGESDPGDSSILYLISTNDGKKGVLIDAYGAYDDANVSDFIRKVSEISKQTNAAKRTNTPARKKRSFAMMVLLTVLGGILLLVVEKKKDRYRFGSVRGVKNKIYSFVIGTN